MTSVLEVEDLSIGYNNHLAVEKISFDVQEGDLLGIVGPNGAGKTTLFRAILGCNNILVKSNYLGLKAQNIVHYCLLLDMFLKRWRLNQTFLQLYMTLFQWV